MLHRIDKQNAKIIIFSSQNITNALNLLQINVKISLREKDLPMFGREHLNLIVANVQKKNSLNHYATPRNINLNFQSSL